MGNDAPLAWDPGSGVDGEGSLESSAAVDLHDLSDVERNLVGEILTSRRVRHRWHTSHLLVPPHLVGEVELAVEQVVAASRDDEAAGDETGEGVGPTVVYEVGAWPVVVHARLAELLVAAGVAHRWERNGDLVVPEADEDAVEALFDELDQSDLDEALDPLPVLEDLHRGLARLSRDPLDLRAREQLISAADDLRRATLPFGFDPPVWRALVAGTSTFAAQLPGLEATRLRERATSLRNDLRSWL